MGVISRPYDRAADYGRVGEFLVRTYRPAGQQRNWLQPRWEYMHFHPYARRVDLGAIGLWEAGGEVVAVVHPEHSMGQAYFQIDPELGGLREEMLAHAEEHLAVEADGTRRLRLFVLDDDRELQEIAARAGYARGQGGEEMSHIPLPAEPPGPLPEGFRLASLAEEDDLRRADRVLWRGFDHGDEPPEAGIEERRSWFSAPNFRKELNVVVVAPDGVFASFCGMWLEPVHAIAYVEPVATDPDHRRMGLARAAVLEGIRRCSELGARVAYVGATLPLYLSIGFQQIYGCSIWERKWR